MWLRISDNTYRTLILSNNIKAQIYVSTTVDWRDTTCLHIHCRYPILFFHRQHNLWNLLINIPEGNLLQAKYNQSICRCWLLFEYISQNKTSSQTLQGYKIKTCQGNLPMCPISTPKFKKVGCAVRIINLEFTIYLVKVQMLQGEDYKFKVKSWLTDVMPKTI